MEPAWLLDPKNGLIHIEGPMDWEFDRERTLCGEDKRQKEWFMWVTSEDIENAKGYEYCATCGLLNKESAIGGRLPIRDVNGNICYIWVDSTGDLRVSTQS
jgi:hypothetical protein